MFAGNVGNAFPASFLSLRMFFSSTLQPLLRNGYSKACFSVDFPSERPSFSGAPHPLQKHLRRQKTAYSQTILQRRECLGHQWEVETQDWIMSDLGGPVPKFGKKTVLELDKYVRKL